MVTHDIGVVASVADRIAVMYGGRIVETGPTRRVLSDPQHPYTRALIRAIPRLTGDIAAAQPLAGRPPTLLTLAPTGCVFRDRCAVYDALGLAACESEDPPLAAVPDDTEGDSRLVACHAVVSSLSAPEVRA
jgi:peptide/nickel transport system ATP-binding protein